MDVRALELMDGPLAERRWPWKPRPKAEAPGRVLARRRENKLMRGEPQ